MCDCQNKRRVVQGEKNIYINKNHYRYEPLSLCILAEKKKKRPTSETR